MIRKMKRSRFLWLFLLLIACNWTPQSEFAGIVSSAAPEATDAGVGILEAGGNAIDAAVAVAFALAVAEPAMSGLGGQTQILLHQPGTAPVAINGTSFAPAATPTDATAEVISEHRATTVPSTVKVLHYAWQHYGSGKVTWADLLAPAIRIAEDGFVLGPYRHKVLLRHADDLAASPSARQFFLNTDGTPPAAGSRWKQPVLANTLRLLATNGAEDFYSGEIARQIAADMAAMGGWITLADLKATPQPVELPALHSTFRNLDVYTLPPPGGGWVVLQILNLLEFDSPDSLQPGQPSRARRLAEALRIGHSRRRNQPVRDLLHYEAEVKKRISKETATALRRISRGETTHFSVVDGNGMAVSVTASINAYYGARVASPDLGFLYNDYMHEFKLGNPTHPFALRPGAMPYSSMSPTIVARNGQPILVLGSPGSSRIISAVVQVIQLWVDAGLPIEQAVATPRFHVYPTGTESRLYIEDPQIRQRLQPLFEAMGYRLVEPADDLATGRLSPYFGGVHALAFEGGGWRGAADPRRDGKVGYVKNKR